MDLICLAYSLFQNFKGLIVDFILSSKYRVSSQEFFQKRSSDDSFRLIEYELSFMYNVLHTKVAVVRSRAGLVLRIISFFFMVGALMFFLFLVDKDEFEMLELILTYSLLIGAIVLDITSGLILSSSDWFLVSLQNWKKYIPNYVLERRWSASVSQYNMIGYCIDWRWIWEYHYPDFVRSTLDKMKMLWFSSSEKNIDDLKRFIFEELKKKSSETYSLSEAVEKCSQRGDGAMFGSSSYIKLKWSISEFQYAESLLLWHLATELCYNDRKDRSSSEDKGLATDNGVGSDQKEKEESTNKNDIDNKRVTKMISDYMFYLLVMKPTMLAPVLGNWQIVFQDTFAEAKRYFTKHPISDHSEACNQLINVKTKFRPAAVKGIRSKSVLFDACILAQQLKHLEEDGGGLEDLKEDQWELMSRVWVELLTYGAINCRPIVHAQQPSKGGEFLTFTWLLMNHLGLGSQFHEQELQEGTKVVAVK
ncbi:uncharacterized protein LOC132799084 [Ziziphus jujuba]|uniref:Uncharacterized protein LOC132799084 n=1 Tax=Ziziphus jujuba TaxID=326968 RepID=A0ABM3IKZ5_ZIZJJ|nr:uncharacterized protein LOC132799084 [Ziziphus jujuba]